MATTKIWPVKSSLKRLVDYASNPEKTTQDDLAAVIEYAMNGDKTTGDNEKACYVTGINCFAENALEEMLNVQRLYGKTGGNVAYHCYQSFKPGEVTPEQCHQLGIELARRMWSDRYQVLVATHLDRDHLHNHLVCCSVSFVDGMKFNDNKGAYAKLRKLSDEICLENGLSVIENPLGKTPRQLHFAEKKGEPTRYNLMREAIDDAISLSTDMSTFIELMRRQGYIIAYSASRKYPTIRSIHSKKPTRLFRLGQEYDLERIEQRVYKNSLESVVVKRDALRSKYFHPAVRHAPARVHRQKLRRISGIYAQYLHYLYLMGYRPAKKHRPLSPEMREACRMCDRYSACARLMAKYHLRTEDDVKDFISSSGHDIDVLSRERNAIKNRLRREKDSGRSMELKEQRDLLTDEIAAVRKEKKTAEFTLKRSEKVREDISIELEYCRGDHLRDHNRVYSARSKGDRER